jgi:hypothetical protein
MQGASSCRRRDHLVQLHAGEAGELDAAQAETSAEAVAPAGGDQDGHGGSANGHAQQLNPPQAEGHDRPGDEDPDELDLYGDMAGEANVTQPLLRAAPDGRHNIFRAGRLELRMTWVCIVKVPAYHLVVLVLMCSAHADVPNTDVQPQPRQLPPCSGSRPQRMP